MEKLKSTKLYLLAKCFQGRLTLEHGRALNCPSYGRHRQHKSDDSQSWGSGISFLTCRHSQNYPTKVHPWRKYRKNRDFWPTIIKIGRNLKYS